MKLKETQDCVFFIFIFKKSYLSHNYTRFLMKMLSLRNEMINITTE